MATRCVYEWWDFADAFDKQVAWLRFYRGLIRGHTRSGIYS